MTTSVKTPLTPPSGFSSFEEVKMSGILDQAAPPPAAAVTVEEIAEMIWNGLIDQDCEPMLTMARDVARDVIARLSPDTQGGAGAGQDVVEGVTIDSADYQHTFFGILNGDGKFWTPLAYESHVAAQKALNKGREQIGGMADHQIVPVRIRLTAGSAEG